MADAPIASDDGSTPVSLVDAESLNDVVINSDGSLDITNIQTLKVTYAAAIRNVATASTATDVLTIAGSATKLVKILRIRISGSQTGNSVTPIVLIKRSALDTGGTFTTLTNVPYDSSDPAATAIVKSYTANPTTLGAAVGTIRQDQVTFNNGLASGLEDRAIFDFGEFSKPVYLRNANENLAINFNSTSVTAASINFTVEWTEE
jgi:hypothetical protein